MLKQYIVKEKVGYKRYLCPNFYTETETLVSDHALSIPPWNAFYSQRVRELADAIGRHADHADDHCVDTWLREIQVLRSMIHGLRNVFKQNEYWEDEMKVDRK